MGTPKFELPYDDDDPDRYEIWSLCAPAPLDVAQILNGITLDVDSNLLQFPMAAMASNNILSRFKAEKDGLEYALIVSDTNDSDNTRLLVPGEAGKDRDKSAGKELHPFDPFRRHINLTSVVSYVGLNDGDTSNVQTDLLLAPAGDRAPKPAFDQSGNGAVDTMRLAYVPVPQREGLKRRWAMPGSRVSTSTPSSLYPAPKKARLESNMEEVVVSDEKILSIEVKLETKKEKRKKEKKTSKKPSKKD